MKSYTDIEQSRKLAEILPLESADMYYCKEGGLPHWKPVYETDYFTLRNTDVPCWSLAALLDILSKTARSIDEDGSVYLCDYKNIEWSVCLNNAADVGLFTADNSVDACVEMIIKLNDLKML